MPDYLYLPIFEKNEITIMVGEQNIYLELKKKSIRKSVSAQN